MLAMWLATLKIAVPFSRIGVWYGAHDTSATHEKAFEDLRRGVGSGSLNQTTEHVWFRLGV